MPQFDFFSFVSQAFWVLFFFSFFYFFVLYFYLSKYSEVIKFRENLKYLKFFYKSGSSTKLFVGMYDLYVIFLFK